MRGKKQFILIALLIIGLSSAFAQFNLPEPVFYDRAAQTETTAAQAAPVIFAQTETGKTIITLWDFNPANLPEPMVFMPIALLAAAGDTDASVAIPRSIRNNQYFRESQRLAQLAQTAFEEGDYDASSNYAKEAVYNAQLSDEYVALQLKIKEANDSLRAAKARLDWAESSGASKTYTAEYDEAKTFYEAGLVARNGEEWDAAIEAANQVINILAYIESPDGKALPARYTVRAWAISKDCFWNIAGRPWAYGDPFKWQIIYNANKAKMPQPDNPDLIHPGMILDIPSIKGEARNGLWDSAKTYDPLR